MASRDTTMSVLEIINEVRRKLGLPTVVNLKNDALQLTLLQFLNQIIADCADTGEWQEMYQETTVLVSAGVAEYSLNINTPLHHIHEMAFDTDPAPLEYRTIRQMRVLRRVANASNGPPRQYTLKGTDLKGFPKFTVFPSPTTAHQTSAKVFDIAYYKKPELLDINNAALRPEFPANVLIEGLWWKALMDEESGTPSQASQQQEAIYKNIKMEALNRFTSDTDGDVFFRPGRGRYH